VLVTHIATVCFYLSWLKHQSEVNVLYKTYTCKFLLSHKSNHVIEFLLSNNHVVMRVTLCHLTILLSHTIKSYHQLHF